MPEDIPSLAWFESRARARADEMHQFLTRSEIRRAAKDMRAEHIAALTPPDPDRDTRILGIISDETPTEAFREISDDRSDRGKAAARRLGLAVAS